MDLQRLQRIGPGGTVNNRSGKPGIGYLQEEDYSNHHRSQAPANAVGSSCISNGFGEASLSRPL